MRARRRRRIGIALLAAGLLAAGGSAARGEAAAAGGACTIATADRLVDQQHLGNAGTVQQPVAQVLCGSFVGPGSRAMVVSLLTPGCGGSIGWAVYRLDASGWHRVFLTSNGAALAKAGTRIRAWQGVLAPSDPHCFPSSWRSRLWHWTGTRLVAGPWHKSGPPPTPLPGVPSFG
jgi:hypothetical protein